MNPCFLTCVVQGLIEHAGGDQGNSALGDAKPPGTVVIVIHTYFHTFRNHTSTINDGSVYGATIQNLAFGQDQRFNDAGI